jgi:hypothetical protein
MEKLHSCQYWAYECQKEAIFNQPHPETGEIVEVCKDHFVLNQAS